MSNELPKEYNIPVKLSKPAHELLAQLYYGQGDPLYALVSRTVDLKQTMASKEEIEAAISALDNFIVNCDGSEEEDQLAENLLYLFCETRE